MTKKTRVTKGAEKDSSNEFQYPPRELIVKKSSIQAPFQDKEEV